MAAQFEAMCKRMHHGFSARNGLYSALLAAGGYTGIKRVFERDYGGFLSMFGEGHDPDASADHERPGRALGDEADRDQAVRGDGRATRAARCDVRHHGEAGAQEPARSRASNATCRMRPITTAGGCSERPLTPIGAQMNIGYALAVAVLDGAAMVQQFSPSRIDRTMSGR